MVAFLSFIFITSYTPGPNNITCASFGMHLGYKQTFKFLMGIVAGFFTVLWICVLLSSVLLEVAPFINTYLKYIGAAYILWLAYHTLKASYTSPSEIKELAKFSRGFLLQLVNPKGIFYGMTIFTTFLYNPNKQILSHAPWIFVLAVVCFSAVSVWTLFGSFIQKYMQNETLKKAINIILSLGLVYTALQILDLF
ncbi:LysE family translocator [Ekhidna sp. MALMAid0563]|uniref:LysE family translocator n=1 Tax=Ekhidna sp. MALMAid0563 TaxID=3143937 RepID=UPI0032DE5C86